jgi:hypothetical protein
MNTEQNKAIELHDSTVGAISYVGNSLVIEFTPAYIHQSVGEPGKDKGTGWIQAVQLRMDDASVTGKSPSLPCKLSDGWLKSDNMTMDNMVPLPYDEIGNITISFHFCTGDEMIITSTHADIVLSGEAIFVDVFP